MQKTLVKTARYQKGATTLFEIIFGAFLLGIISWMLAANMGSFLAAKQQAFNAEQAIQNQKVTQALLSWSEVTTAIDPFNPSIKPMIGKLPNPCVDYTGGAKTLYSFDQSCNLDLAEKLAAVGIDANTAEFASPVDNRIRVYQKITGNIGATKPDAVVGIFGKGSPSVNLKYDIGVVFTVNCNINDPCYESGLAMSRLGIHEDTGTFAARYIHLDSPGDGTFTLAPLEAPEEGVMGVTYVSTLNLQKKLLATTANRIAGIREALKTYFLTKQAAEPVATRYTKNFYPDDSTVTQSPASVAASGCRHAWVLLNDANSTVLKKIGLITTTTSPAVINSEQLYQEGATAWGGAIEYCSDFDPANQDGGADRAPHIAALRVNTDITSGDGPSPTPTDNTYIIF